jgi:hypothetical protein
MIVTGDSGKVIRCDHHWDGVCDNKIVAIIITETWGPEDNYDQPHESTIFVCAEHAPEMMHEVKSGMSSEETIWTIDLGGCGWHPGPDIKKVQG